MSAAETVISLLERLAKGDGPGDLNYDEPALRVWVQDPDDAPPGHPTHRCPGGMHYYDVPLPQVDAGCEPDSFVYVEPVEPGDPYGQNPYGLMAEKLDDGVALKRAVYVSDPSEAPGGADVRQDSQGRHYYIEQEDDEGWQGSTRDDFEVPVWEPDDIQDPAVGPLKYDDERDDWVGADPDEIEVLSGKAWIPYQGPQGGHGWRNADSDEIVYQSEPPGSIADPGDMDITEMAAALPAMMEDPQAEGLRESVSEGDITEGDLEAVFASAADSNGLDMDQSDQFGEITGETPDGLGEGDPINIDGEEAVVREVMTMGGGQYILADAPGGETVSARVGPDDRVRAPTDPDMVLESADGINTGDRVEIDGQEAEVVRNTDMGGGNYIVAETPNGEEISTRVGPAEKIPADPQEGSWTGPIHTDPVEPTESQWKDAIEWKFDDPDSNSLKITLENEGVDAMIDQLSPRERKTLDKEAKRPERFQDNHAPDHLDPSQAIEVEDLSSAGENQGVTAGAMDVALMPNAEKLYVTHVSPEVRGEEAFYDTAASHEDASVAAGSANALQAMGVSAPDTHYEHNRFFSVEEAGTPIHDAHYNVGEDLKERIDPMQARRSMGAQMLIGNRDAHSQNVSVTDSDELVAFDLDLAGKDSTDWMETGGGGIPKASRSLSKATVWNEREARTQLKEAAKELANNLDKDEVLSQIDDPAMKKTVSDNIDAWREA